MQTLNELVVQNHVLTGEQAMLFKRDGFLLMPQLLASEEVNAIRETFMQQNASGPVPGLSEITASGQVYDASDPLAFYPRMMHPHMHPELPVGQIAMRYLLEPRFLPILTDLMEEAPVAVQSMFYFKPPGARGQELHQDNYYLRVAPRTCMAAWLAIDDVDAENGGMKVVAGSQKCAIACPQKADPAVSFTKDYVPVPEGMAAVHCDMKAGDVLFFNGSLIHGSTPNRSADRFRRSLIFHYVPENSEEMSAMYHSRLRFDGQEASPIAAAEGGGPCGTPQPAILH